MTSGDALRGNSKHPRALLLRSPGSERVRWGRLPPPVKLTATATTHRDHDVKARAIKAIRGGGERARHVDGVERQDAPPRLEALQLTAAQHDVAVLPRASPSWLLNLQHPDPKRNVGGSIGTQTTLSLPSPAILTSSGSCFTTTTTTFQLKLQLARKPGLCATEERGVGWAFLREVWIDAPNKPSEAPSIIRGVTFIVREEKRAMHSEVEERQATRSAKKAQYCIANNARTIAIESHKPSHRVSHHAPRPHRAVLQRWLRRG
jgi:hypothetical protein